MTGISLDKFRERWKNKFLRGGKWEVTEHSYICNKHFVDSDFVTHSADKKTRRARKVKKTLLRRYLKKDKFPTIFQDCPQYLSNKKPAPRTSSTTPSERNAIVLKMLQDKKLQEQRLDVIKTLKDIEHRRIKSVNPVLKYSKFIVGNDKITICGISVDNEGLPKVKYTLLINQDLKFKVWQVEKNVLSTRYEHILKGKVFFHILKRLFK